MTTPTFDAVKIAASVLPGMDELGSGLRRREGLNVGPGGQHFLLVTAVRSNELAGRLRYRDLGMVHYTNRRVRSHVRQIEALGFIVTLAQLLNHPPPA